MIADRERGGDVAIRESVGDERQHVVFARGQRFEQRLAGRLWMMGDRYTVLDMAVWGWGRSAPTALGDDPWEQLPNLKRLLDTIDARPAAQRALALKDRYRFKTDMDEQARRAMFPHLQVPGS